MHDALAPSIIDLSPVALTSPTSNLPEQTPGGGSTSYSNHVISTREEERADDSRYVGHLNPESAFILAASPATTNSADADKVGVWLSEKLQPDRPTYLSSLPRKNAKSNAIYIPDLMISKLLLPHLEDECLSLIPTASNYDALRGLYFKQAHPLFPILDEVALQAMQPQLPGTILLKQAICLAGSSCLSAEPFLHFTSSEPQPLSRAEYAQKLSLALRTSLNLGLVSDKFVLSQVFALLSLFTQFADDRHLSAELNARAVAHFQTLGIHVAPELSATHSTRLFLSIWALDRLNAAFHGRPTIMKQEDFGQDVERCIEKQEPSFQLFLRTVLLLDRVIDLYRPKASARDLSWDADFPDFEDIVERAGASTVGTTLIGVWYSHLYVDPG